METETEILLKKGMGNILFGTSVDDVVKQWGEADEVEDLTVDEDTNTIVLHYDNKYTTLFFEEQNPVLACIETGDTDIKLFGKTIFDLSEKEITKLMVDNGFLEQDIETEEWGERRISFEKASIDFFFEDDELLSVVFGK